MTESCRCKHSLIDIQGICKFCGLERLHIVAKKPMTTAYLPPDDEKDAA